MKTIYRIDIRVVEDRGITKVFADIIDFKSGKIKGSVRPILVDLNGRAQML